MATKEEVQSLLRFLAQDAKIPLSTALGKVKELQDNGLTSPDAISKNSITKIQAIFKEDKEAKAILSAAKRVAKKRSHGETDGTSPSKKRKNAASAGSIDASPAEIEASLKLPTTTASEDELEATVLHTNRAPLVLAFAVTLLECTEPHQPLSSRLSLGHGLVSANSRSKAVSIGLAEKGTGAEEEGWGQGQPGLKVMGRDIRVMKRHGYDWKASEEEKSSDPDDTAKGEEQDSPALWGLDLEALRASNTPLVSGNKAGTGAGLPVYTAESARAYLMRSFASAPSQTGSAKKTVAALQAEKEENLARLLACLRLLYGSWSHVLSRDELDRRAWSWYIAVRPDVKDGAAGWGGRGEVKLEKLLHMRRKG